MRRRRPGGEHSLSAEELVAVAAAIDIKLSGSLEVRNHERRLLLAELGYTPLDVIRARYWLRRGKPADYEWDDAAVPPRRSPTGRKRT